MKPILMVVAVTPWLVRMAPPEPAVVPPPERLDGPEVVVTVDPPRVPPDPVVLPGVEPMGA